MIRIVCDTNVLVSAILFGGNAREIVDLVSGGRVVGIVSLDICQELERVLLRPKFGLTAAQVAGTLELVQDTFRVVTPRESIRAVPQDPDDDRILEAAIAGDAACIVSGDRHLLALGTFRGCEILTPSSFLHRWYAAKGTTRRS